jgi:hypothetical protein
MAVPFEKWSCEKIVGELSRLISENVKEDQDHLDELFDYFLFAYSPEKHFSLVKENSKFLKNEVLREFVINRAFNAYDSVIFLEAANLLASLGILMSFISLI